MTNLSDSQLFSQRLPFVAHRLKLFAISAVVGKRAKTRTMNHFMELFAVTPRGGAKAQQRPRSCRMTNVSISPKTEPRDYYESVYEQTTWEFEVSHTVLLLK